LQASPRQHALTKALQEYGRVVKTLCVLRYLESEEYRRRINSQLNKGESLHALRGWLFFAEEGGVRRRHLDEQTNQANCLNLVTNAIITWNTVYIAEALRQLRAEGHAFCAEAIAHLSPAMYAHVNRYGKYTFNVEPMQPGQLRPLREPTPASP
jgi:TnpA family transposase